MKTIEELSKNFTNNDYEEIIEELSQNALQYGLIICSGIEFDVEKCSKVSQKDILRNLLEHGFSYHTFSLLKEFFNNSGYFNYSQDDRKLLLLSVYSIYLRIKENNLTNITYLLNINYSTKYDKLEFSLFMSNASYDQKNPIKSFVDSCIDTNKFTLIMWFNTWYIQLLEDFEKISIPKIKNRFFKHKWFPYYCKSARNKFNEEVKSLRPKPISLDDIYLSEYLMSITSNFAKSIFNINILLKNHLIKLSDVQIGLVKYGSLKIIINNDKLDVGLKDDKLTINLKECNYYNFESNLINFSIIQIQNDNLILDTNQVVPFTLFLKEKIDKNWTQETINTFAKLI